jgi:hypothetical protein
MTQVRAPVLEKTAKQVLQKKPAKAGKQYKLAAIDLDGTLLNHERGISPENRAAVERLLANNIDVVLASGRRHEDILRFHQELGLESPIVSCHGALVKDPITDEVISNRSIPKEMVENLIALALKNQFSWIVYDKGGVHLSKSEYWLTEYVRRSAFGLPNVYDSHTDYAFTHAEKVNWMGDVESIREQFHHMTKTFAGKLTSVITDPDHLEFTRHGADKSTGLMDLTARMGIESEEVITFGDSNNDVPMLAWAGLGVAMHHGTSEARSAAKMVSPAGDEASSLARAVDAILESFNHNN